jgi:hypothetical protein
LYITSKIVIVVLPRQKAVDAACNAFANVMILLICCQWWQRRQGSSCNHTWKRWQQHCHR